MKWLIPFAVMCLIALMVVSTAVNSAPAQSAADAQPRFAKWEYKVLNAPADNGIIQGYKLEPKLNELGLEGWEFAGAIADVRGDITYGYVILKRTKR